MSTNKPLQRLLIAQGIMGRVFILQALNAAIDRVNELEARITELEALAGSTTGKEEVK